MQGDTTESCHRVLLIGPAPLLFLSSSPGSARAHSSARWHRAGALAGGISQAVCFGASLTVLRQLPLRVLGFLDFFSLILSCILCRDVGMKTAFVLPKPPYVALLPSPAGADAVLCLHRVGAVGFGGRSCWEFGGRPGLCHFAFLFAAF